MHQTGAPFGILLAGAVWVPKEAFQHIPTVNLMGDGDHSGIRPQKASMPIKTTLADRGHSGKKLDISKIKGAHLLFEMQDQQEKARGNEPEAKDQTVTSHQVASRSTVPRSNFLPDFRQSCQSHLTKELSPSQRIWPLRPPGRVRNAPMMMLLMRW